MGESEWSLHVAACRRMMEIYGVRVEVAASGSRRVDISGHTACIERCVVVLPNMVEIGS